MTNSPKRSAKIATFWASRLAWDQPWGEKRCFREKSALPDTVTLSEGSAIEALSAFVILPFVERDAKTHAKGFFSEVLRSLIIPAEGRKNFEGQDRQPPG